MRKWNAHKSRTSHFQKALQHYKLGKILGPAKHSLNTLQKSDLHYMKLHGIAGERKTLKKTQGSLNLFLQNAFQVG